MQKVPCTFVSNWKEEQYLKDTSRLQNQHNYFNHTNKHTTEKSSTKLSTPHQEEKGSWPCSLLYFYILCASTLLLVASPFLDSRLETIKNCQYYQEKKSSLQNSLSYVAKMQMTGSCLSTISAITMEKLLPPEEMDYHYWKFPSVAITWG